MVHSCSVDFCGFVQSAAECKELQLSGDQNPAGKPGHRFPSAQDHPRHFRGKGVRMKSKARAAPYPEVVQSGLWLPLLVLLFIKTKKKTTVPSA